MKTFDDFKQEIEREKAMIEMGYEHNPERKAMEESGMCVNCGRVINPNMAQCEYCCYCYPDYI